MGTTRNFYCKFFEPYLQVQQPDIHKQEGISIGAFIVDVQTIMTHNVFKFGDLFLVQFTGETLGPSSAPMYATLYFANHEINIVLLSSYLQYYGQYINDVLLFERSNRTLTMNKNAFT